MTQHLSHTLPIFINDNSEILILGSFPSVKSREYNFYYSHPRNRFFKVMYSLFNEDYSSCVEDKKTFLKKHKIALYDVIYECDISSSYDSSIKNVIPIDITSILNKFPNIRVIGVTGGKAKELFNKYLLSKVKDKRIIYLPSTSPANAKMTLDELIKEYAKILV